MKDRSFQVERTQSETLGWFSLAKPAFSEVLWDMQPHGHYRKRKGIHQPMSDLVASFFFGGVDASNPKNPRKNWSSGSKRRILRVLQAGPVGMIHCPQALPGVYDSTGLVKRGNGCGSKLTRRGKPQVLVHVSTSQGNPFGIPVFEP